MSETLAKRCLPLFVQSLTTAEAPAVRNNILVALVDLCVRYTALVDPHVLRLASCFRVGPDQIFLWNFLEFRFRIPVHSAYAYGCRKHMELCLTTYRKMPENAGVNF